MTLFYSLRRSEVPGLKWENIDFEGNTFEIKSTIVRIKSIIHSDETKTADSNAVFELLPEFKDMLLELKAQAAGFGVSRLRLRFLQTQRRLLPPGLHF